MNDEEEEEEKEEEGKNKRPWGASMVTTTSATETKTSTTTRHRLSRLLRDDVDEHNEEHNDNNEQDNDNDNPGAHGVSRHGPTRHQVKGSLTPAPLEEEEVNHPVTPRRNNTNLPTTAATTTEKPAAPGTAESSPNEAVVEDVAQGFLANTNSMIGTAEVLGVVEAVDDDDESAEEKKQFQRDVWRFIAFAILIIGVVVGVVFGVLASRDGTTTTPPPPNPPDQESERVQSLQEILSPLSIGDNSTKNDLLAKTAPQYQALVWLADNDQAQIPIDDTRRLTQRYGLATLYFATNGIDWNGRFHFLSSRHECDWNSGQEMDTSLPVLGVSCSDDTAKVVSSVYLSENHLVGSIPLETLNALTDLRYLNLSSNTVSCSLSEKAEATTSTAQVAGLEAFDTLERIAKFASESLQVLDLSNNALEATIPSEISRLSNLTRLYLNDNALSSRLPTELGLLTNLEELHIQENQLWGGNLEELVRNFKRLQTLNAQGNDFVVSRNLGFVAASSLPALTTLNLNGNSIHWPGILFSWRLIGLTNVVELQLEDMGIRGSIPPDLATVLPQLQILNLKNNDLVSSIPSEIKLLTNLQDLSLGRNQLTGNIPADLLVELSNLQILNLEQNQFSGMFPWASSTFNLYGYQRPNLRVLQLESCGLTGTIPWSIGQWFPFLEFWDMNSNELGGSITASFGDLTYLKHVIFSRNFLEGTIPTTVGRMTSLQTFQVQFNSLTGNLPTEMENMAALVYVDLRFNGFVGGSVEFLCSKEVAAGESVIGCAGCCTQNITCGCCRCG